MPETAEAFDCRSLYVPMRDGVRLAVSVLMPAGFTGKRPALAVFTRYGRATRAGILAIPFSESLAFMREGFVVVSVDVRGTGASFGRRLVEKGREEIRDYGEIFDWIVAQPWSDGRIVSTGVSYLGNACEAALINNHPALVAVAPRFTDFDLYEHLLFPGGMPDVAFALAWAEMTATLDRGETLEVSASDREAAERSKIAAAAVDGDDGTLFRAAIAEHGNQNGLAERFARIVFRDDGGKPAANGDRAVDLCDAAAEIVAGARPAFHWASWLDAGTAAGVLARFHTLDMPMRIKIGAWNHGAMQDASPYTPVDTPPVPDRPSQIREIAAFFHARLAGEPLPARKSIEYFTLGAGCWRATQVWPPVGLAVRDWYFDAEDCLSDAPGATGHDSYHVDFAASSGKANRWTTQLGRDVDYRDRRAADAVLKTYTSAPLSGALEITGTPLATLQVASNRTDGNFIVYLAEVAPNGRVTYLTEGGLRALHRAVSDAPARYVRPGPNRSFLRADATPLVPGEFATLCFPLLPLSVVIKAGHRLRVSLAGADDGIFERLPPEGDADWTIARGAGQISFVRLPCAPWTP